MLKKIVWAKAFAEHQIYLKFQNGVEGVLDLKSVAPFEGIFAPLKDQAYFETLELNTELGTVQWKNGADLAPETLYKAIFHKVPASPTV